MLGGSTAIAIDNFTPFQTGNLTLNLTGQLRMTNLTNPDDGGSVNHLEC